MLNSMIYHRLHNATAYSHARKTQNLFKLIIEVLLKKLQLQSFIPHINSFKHLTNNTGPQWDK